MVADQEVEAETLWGEKMTKLALQREKAYQDHLVREEQSRGKLQRELDQLDRMHSRLEGMKEDVLVLLRSTPGPELSVYHSAMWPCRRVTGRGHSRSNFAEMLEGEAQARAVRRCSACRWPTPSL